MKRMVAIAAAMLVAILIIGYSIHSINRIDKINRKNKEKEEAKDFAVIIAQTTAATEVWDQIQVTIPAVQDATLPPQESETAVQTGVPETVPTEETKKPKYQIFTHLNENQNQSVTTTVPVQ
ncbi:MAG: hypothetical protein IJN11_07210 [Oscillospiraceae bacterium]|nr:hypothetical protein [Oscillospiraceae bacterium]